MRNWFFPISGLDSFSVMHRKFFEDTKSSLFSFLCLRVKLTPIQSVTDDDAVVKFIAFNCWPEVVNLFQLNEWQWIIYPLTGADRISENVMKLTVNQRKYFLPWTSVRK